MFPETKTKLDINCCLLAASIYYVVIHSEDLVFVISSIKNEHEVIIDSKLKSKLISEAQKPDKLMAFICEESVGFTDFDLFMKIYKPFAQILQQIISPFIGKESIGQMEPIFSEENVSQVHRFLEESYQEGLSPESFDDLLFDQKQEQAPSNPMQTGLFLSKESISSQKVPYMTPSKFLKMSNSCSPLLSPIHLVKRTQEEFLGTPRKPGSSFSRLSGSIGCFLSQNSSQSWASPKRNEHHFEQALEAYYWLEQFIQKGAGQGDFNFKTAQNSEKISFRISSFKGNPVIYQTNLGDSSAKMEVEETEIILPKCLQHYFMSENSKESGLVFEQLFNMVKQLETSEENNENISANQLFNFFLGVLSEILNKEEKSRKGNKIGIYAAVKNVNFLKATLALAADIYLFVVNHKKGIQETLQQFGVTSIQAWKNIYFFSRFEPRVPLSIRKRLGEVEFTIMFELAWRKHSEIYPAIKKIRNIKESLNSPSPEERMNVKQEETETNQRNSDHSFFSFEVIFQMFPHSFFGEVVLFQKAFAENSPSDCGIEPHFQSSRPENNGGSLGNREVCHQRERGFTC